MRTWLIAVIVAAAGCGGFFFKNKKPVWISPAGDTPLVITNNSKVSLCILSIEFSDWKEPPNADPYTVGKPHYQSLTPLQGPDAKQPELKPGESMTVGVKQHDYDVFIMACGNTYFAKKDKISVRGPTAFGIDGPDRTAPATYARTEFDLEAVPPSSGSSEGSTDGEKCLKDGDISAFAAEECCNKTLSLGSSAQHPDIKFSHCAYPDEM